MSAPARGEARGKILLFGEHAVVYGEPAVGLPLSRGVWVELMPGRGRVKVTLARGITALPSRRAATPRALAQAVFGERLARLDLHIGLDLPPMAGFGSSAALGIALCRAQDNLQRALGERLDRRPLLQRALAVEQVAHGRPSGVDPASCLAAGPISFRRTGRRMSVTPLLLARPLHLVVGHAGSHGGAGRSISRLAELKRDEPKLVAAVMKGLGAASSSAARALAGGKWTQVGELMSLSHGTLSGLGLVAAPVDRAVQRLIGLGALGAKMSGAGGVGGAFVALFDDAASARRAAARVSREGAPAWVESWARRR